MGQSPDTPNLGGRPRIISSPEEFDEKVESYRAKCERTGESPTFSGLAYHLGFADRRSLYDYAKYEGFSRSVKRAQLLVESEYERRLGESNYGGAIFALKNHGWSDRQDLSHSGEIRGGVLVVPAGTDPAAWEQAAAEQQRADGDD